MKAKVTITKSFDDGKAFSKEWEEGAFQKFFSEEGEYLDKLSKIIIDKAQTGEGFTVKYTVEVTK